MSFEYTKKVEFSFLEALDEARLAFVNEGFGVVSNINVGEKIRKKKDDSFGEYVILGMCKPEIAYEYITKDMKLGVFLPCSVAVYEKDNGVYISVGLPEEMISKHYNDIELNKLSIEVGNSVKRAIDSI